MGTLCSSPASTQHVSTDLGSAVQTLLSVRQADSDCRQSEEQEQLARQWSRGRASAAITQASGTEMKHLVQFCRNEAFAVCSFRW